MKGLNGAKKILGMEMSGDKAKDKLCLTQKQYQKIYYCIFVNTALAQHSKLTAVISPKSQEKQEYMAKILCANAVDNLMYAMMCKRPDLSHAIGVVP